MDLQVAKWGNSLALRIPSEVVRPARIARGRLWRPTHRRRSLSIRPAQWNRKAFALELTAARSAMPMNEPVMEELRGGARYSTWSMSTAERTRTIVPERTAQRGSRQLVLTREGRTRRCGLVRSGIRQRLGIKQRTGAIDAEQAQGTWARFDVWWLPTFDCFGSTAGSIVRQNWSRSGERFARRRRLAPGLCRTTGAEHMATLDDVLSRNAQRLKIKPVVLRGTP